LEVGTKILVEECSQLGNFLYLCYVRVIAKSTLRAFWARHADCEQQLKTWFKETEDAHWRGPNEIKREYPSASFLADNRVVFNIKGNHYRLVVKINYDYGIVWIRFIGTHQEYDKINASSI
jgi:mRNA interferase HigB